MPNPFCTAEGWYWYDETWDETGPYPTREAALTDLREHCREVLLMIDEELPK